MKKRMERIGSGARGGLAACAGLLLAACSLPPAQPDLTRFFLLTGTAAPAAAPAAAPVRIALRPVAVPEFLRGTLMEVRVSGNEVRYIDTARWAEPLDAGLKRVLGEDLVRRGAGQLAARGEPHDFDVVVQLRECEGVRAAGAARLAAHVEIFTTELDPRLVGQADFATEVPGWNGTDYADLAEKLSEAADRLSGRIAELLADAKK